MQVETERRVYQSSFPELFERLEDLTFAGETEVEVDGVVYNAVRDVDAEGDFYLLLPRAKPHHVATGRAQGLPG